MQVKGMLLTVRRYSFRDKENGNQVQGAKLSVALPSDKPDVIGLVVQDIPTEYEQFSTFVSQSNGLLGKQVVVDCDITLSGRYTKLKAVSLKAA